ncbi:hypothetical protein GY12_20180 [Micrococcus luteus]|nr:hypothetical protein GY12_20180 [Micrococcus luteus]
MRTDQINAASALLHQSEVLSSLAGVDPLPASAQIGVELQRLQRLDERQVRPFASRTLSSGVVASTPSNFQQIRPTESSEQGGKKPGERG